MSTQHKIPTRINVNARIKGLRKSCNLPSDLFEFAVAHGYALLEKMKEDAEDDPDVLWDAPDDFACGYLPEFHPGLSSLNALVCDFLDDNDQTLLENMTKEQDQAAWKIALQITGWAKENDELRAMPAAERAEKEAFYKVIADRMAA
ncbi:MAG: hypothetical protein ACYCSN_16610 [Acidobacteriaceae bacterium]